MRQLAPAGLALAAMLALGACGLGGMLDSRNTDNRTANGAPPKPTITYDYNGDSRAEVDAKATAYCEEQGRSAYIRGVVTDNGSVHHATYDCR
jgi:hypothetical protein